MELTEEIRMPSVESKTLVFIKLHFIYPPGFLEGRQDSIGLTCNIHHTGYSAVGAPQKRLTVLYSPEYSKLIVLKLSLQSLGPEVVTEI